MSINWPYEVWVGSDILSFSFEVPYALVAVFNEEDRISLRPQEEDDDEDRSDYRYEATVKTIRDRLQIMGYTSDRWRAELELFRQQQLEEIEEQIAKKEGRGQSASKWKRMALVIEHSLSERWINTLTAMLSDGWGWCRRQRRSFALAKAMTDGDYGPIQMPFTDERCLLRALADLHDDTDLVQFEFGPAVSEEDVDPNTDFTRVSASALLDGARAVEKIIVLTEGKTDTRILEQSFDRLYPHLKHMFTFFDHAAFRSGGGASELERLARGFAGAGISNRTVVLFDNDTSGFAASRRLMDAQLPANFRVLTLPELDVAKAYPTLGPTGAALTNINGSACSIELYCGPTALIGEEGSLSPIQWTGYDRALKRYQGEPMGKEKIQERFFGVLDRSSDPLNDIELASIRDVLQSIMRIDW
jgi:HEPN/Toprim N-terminal domain 1